MRYLLLLLTLIVPGSQALAVNLPTDEAIAAEMQRLCPDCNLDQLRKTVVDTRKVMNSVGQRPVAETLGFLEATDASLPGPVRLATKSTLHILVLQDDLSQLKKLPVDKLEQIIPLLAASKDPADIMYTQLFTLYTSRCKAAGETTCAIPGFAAGGTSGLLGGGSSFLVGDSGTDLWSANHVMADPLKEALQKTNSRWITDLISQRYRFNVLIFDSENRLVATPFDNGLRIVRTNHNLPIKNPTVPEIDGLRMELERPLAIPGLKIAARPLRIGDRVFHIGFPQCTGCGDGANQSELVWLTTRTSFPFEDAPGSGLRVTAGKVIEKTSVYTSATDGNTGMSGGPSVNASGEVVGINSQMALQTDPLLMVLFRSELKLAPLYMNSAGK